MSERILIIKHGAFGDFIQATGALQAIRQHHPQAHITLLTTKPYIAMAQQMPFVDMVWQDERPRLTSLRQWQDLRQRIIAGSFTHVYDLQNTHRTAAYFWMLRGHHPVWSGLVRGCTFPHRTKHRRTLHTIDRLAEQLNIAGISDIPAPTVDWLVSSGKDFSLPEPYALLIPGGAPHRHDKRWTVEGFSQVATQMLTRGVTPVLIGTQADADMTNAIEKNVPACINLTGKTGFGDLVSLAGKARLALGNDTGPMHLLAVAECRTIVLFGSASDPKRCAPRGRDIQIVQVADLQSLTADTVLPLLFPVGTAT